MAAKPLAKSLSSERCDMVQDIPVSDVAVEHPSREQLQAFGLGRLEAEVAAQVFDHLETCGACRALVASMPDDTLSALVRASATPQDASEAVDASVFASPAAETDFLAGHPRYRILD